MNKEDKINWFEQFELDSVEFMQVRDLTDEEWLQLPKEEILQLYKNVYKMLMDFQKTQPVTTADVNRPGLRQILIDFADYWQSVYNAPSDKEIDEFLKTLDNPEKDK